MDTAESFFFAVNRDTVLDAYTAESFLALADKLQTVQRYRDAVFNGEELPQLHTPDSEFAIEQPKVEPHIVFASTWNPDEQPLKYFFDKSKWDSVKLLNELAKYLYGFEWHALNAGSCKILHPRLISFLQLEYQKLTEGSSAVYYRWQSKKYQERYLLKLKSSAEHEVAASVAASGTGKGLAASGTGGSSSNIQYHAPRPRIGSAASIATTLTVNSHGGESFTAKHHKKRRVPSPSKISEVSVQLHSGDTNTIVPRHKKTGCHCRACLARRYVEGDGIIGFQDQEDYENQSGLKDRHVSRVQFVWSATARLREKEGSEPFIQPIAALPLSNQLISIESLPQGASKASSRGRDLMPVPSPAEVNKSRAVLKRTIELFKEMFKRRESEDKKWIETGRIYTCRVICYGDRRSALLSRSKSAAIPTSTQSVSASVSNNIASAIPPPSAHSARPTRASTTFTPSEKKRAVNELNIFNAFNVLSSFNTPFQRNNFTMQDAIHGKIPSVPSLEYAAYKKSIFVAALPDGSHSAYYSNGKPAVVQSCYLVKGFPSSTHTTTLALNHTAVGDVILVATPHALSAYAPKYDKRLFADRKNLTIITAEIHVEKYPCWYSKKLKSTIHFELTEHLTLSLQAPDRIGLTFSNQATSESFKFSLGLTPDETPQPEIKFLQTVDIEFQSKSAFELIKSSTKVKTISTSQQKGFASSQRSPAASMSKSEQIAKKLGIIDNNYASTQLERLKNKVAWICESWLSHYCLWLGVIEIRGLGPDRPASRLFNRLSARRIAVRSAGVAGNNSLSDDELNYNGSRCESGYSRDNRRPRSKRATSHDPKMVENQSTGEQELNNNSTINRERKNTLSRAEGKEKSKTGTATSKTSQRTTSPPSPLHNVAAIDSPSPDRGFKALSCRGFTEFHLIGLCPISLRRHMTNGIDTFSAPSNMKFCHCSRQKTPVLTDTEIDLFLTKLAPQNQMIVVHIVNSELKRNSACGYKLSQYDEFEDMFDNLYSSLSTYRPRPCVDSVSDRFRLLRYDISTAVMSAIADCPPDELLPLSSLRRVPLFVRRHNVRRGMTLMYHGGALVSCGFISPTTNALLRQIELSWRLALRSFSLPSDYRISLSAGHYPDPAVLPRQMLATEKQSEAFLAKYILPTSPTPCENKQFPETDDQVVAAMYSARDGPHSSHRFPCLHMPTV